MPLTRLVVIKVMSPVVELMMMMMKWIEIPSREEGRDMVMKTIEEES